MKKIPVTITLEGELDKKIRKLQAKIINETNRNWSYSAMMNLVVAEGLDHFELDSKKISKKK